MKYTDFLNQSYDCGCLGCAIAAGEVSPPGGILRETAHFLLDHSRHLHVWLLPRYLWMDAMAENSLSDIRTLRLHMRHAEDLAGRVMETMRVVKILPDRLADFL